MASMHFFEVDNEDRQKVALQFPQTIVHAEPFSLEAHLASCQSAEVIACFIYSTFSRAVLQQLPALRLLITRSVGYDHIDLSACRERGITVCNVPDYGSHVIAEHVFALLLGTLRNIHRADERVQQGNFDYHGLRGIALRGKTIGIVGTGKIGQRVARIAHGFGMKILATDICRNLELEALGVQYVTLSQICHESDIITLHVPALPETEHMINAAAFTEMKPGVILVNTARGSLIDSAALLNALEKSIVSHALLDTLEHEQNFSENKALISHPRVVVTPHIAFYADDSMQNMYDDCFESIRQWQNGLTPEHTVQPATVQCDLPGIVTK